ncbi:patatin-like phospholipase family protein [Paludisphaera soli]|uniref:patatin-like phospholipase family protein n=1 Tax=Paludisphaera soli TaxID=2712865 RepID=UPI0013ED4B26|nr:patatin-like phospholipase family protein [Paludisphaera soli]
MPKIGLALSGGGFRATLYHLGIIRFLRDAGALENVSHITSVSGGSILAAHLVLNWDRYNGPAEEFDKAAKEILDFVRMDVRNRIVRRYPFAVLATAPRWLTRRPVNRRYTRAGMLEYHYQKHLYGDTCLYELPDKPELHILATNLSEGCITSFTRSGLILQRRLPGDRIQFERIQAGLATIPLAVAASSAFPGFFPPIQVRSQDIGASEAAFSHQAFTDGGVFDNLGIRAFRFIERCWSETCRPTDADGREVEVEEPEEADLEPAAVGAGGPVQSRPSGRDSNGQVVEAEDAEPGDGTGAVPDHVPGAPPSVRPSVSEFDVVIASDAGAKLSITRDAFSGGLIQTAMRASDILMDRVWQLEKEIFGAAAGFLFTPIYRLVEPEEDPTAPLPVIQRQIVGMRTDLDRFSSTEIRSLVRHGYCVARQACRSRPDVFGDVLPDGPPWDPMPEKPRKLGRILSWRDRPANDGTVLARQLQASASRRIFSTLLDWRDAMTYVFLPFMLLLLLAGPYLLYRTYVSSTGVRQALGLVAEGSPDEARLLSLVRDGPVASLDGLTPVPADRFAPTDYRGFEFLSDSHIVDLRRWERSAAPWPAASEPQVYQHRRYLVRRTEVENAGDHLRFHLTSRSPDLVVNFLNKNLSPVLRRTEPEPTEGDGVTYRWELDLDFSGVPHGEVVEVVVEQIYRGPEIRAGRVGVNSLVHVSNGVTKVASMWILMPSRRPAGRLSLIGYKIDAPEERRPIRPTRMFEVLDGAVVGWQIIGPDPDTTYEGHWILD